MKQGTSPRSPPPDNSNSTAKWSASSKVKNSNQETTDYLKWTHTLFQFKVNRMLPRSRPTCFNWTSWWTKILTKTSWVITRQEKEKSEATIPYSGALTRRIYSCWGRKITKTSETNSNQRTRPEWILITNRKQSEALQIRIIRITGASTTSPTIDLTAESTQTSQKTSNLAKWMLSAKSTG